MSGADGGDAPEIDIERVTIGEDKAFDLEFLSVAETDRLDAEIHAKDHTDYDWETNAFIHSSNH